MTAPSKYKGGVPPEVGGCSQEEYPLLYDLLCFFADKIHEETNLPDDFSHQTGISDNEMSKRSVDSVSKTFAKLKSTFVTLGKPKLKLQPRRRIRRFRSRNAWGRSTTGL